jgi:hypothetical protein
MLRAVVCPQDGLADGVKAVRVMTGNECQLKADICASGFDYVQHRRSVSAGYAAVHQQSASLLPCH